MTLNAASVQIWEALGEPSDLNPSTVGVTKLRDAVNEAQDAVAMWIDDRGRKPYFRESQAQVLFSTTVESGTLGVQTGQTITLPLTVNPELGKYVGWVLKIGNEVRGVVASLVSGGQNVLSVNEAFSSDVSGLDYLISKRHYTLAEMGGTVRIVEALQVFDVESSTELSEVSYRDALMVPSVGIPSSWRHGSGGVVFDSAPETSGT